LDWLKELLKSYQTGSTELTKITNHNERNLFSHQTKPFEFEWFDIIYPLIKVTRNLTFLKVLKLLNFGTTLMNG